MPHILVTLRLLLAALLLAVSSAQAAPLAGSLIENQATASYRDEATGLHSTAISNTVRVVVEAVEAVAMSADRNTTRAPGASFALSHRLSNTGNTPARYRMAFGNAAGNAFDAASLRLVRDLNGNGQADTGEPEANEIALEPGESADWVLSGTVPGTASRGSKLGLFIRATGSSQSVVAENIDAVTVGEGAVLVLAKRASDSAPERGEEVVFTVTATNQGNTPANGVPVTVDGAPTRLIVLRDVVPANTVLRDVAGSGSGSGMALYHRAGDAKDAYVTQSVVDADAAAWGVPALAPGQTIELRMTVRINDNAHEAIRNTAEAGFDDGGRTLTASSNTVVLTLSPQAAALAGFNDAGFSTEANALSVGAPLYLQADLASCNRASHAPETVAITVTATRTGDAETFIAEETELNSGLFRVSFGVPTRDAESFAPVSGNGVLEVRRDDSLSVRVAGCNGEALETTVLIDPFGVVFDSRSNQAIAGATVRLIDVSGDGNGGNAGGPARVFLADGVTPASASVVTGADGRYAFPLVAQSSYRLEVTPPAGFNFPSQLPPALMPVGRAIHVSGSYGGSFPVNLATGAVNIDLPLDDVSGNGLFVEKTASRTVAEIAEFVDYGVRVKNVSGSALYGVTLRDTLPHGFRYERGSARLDGAAIADPPGGAGPVLEFSIGTLSDGAEARLSYRVKIGVDARQGDGVNRAQAVSAAPFPKFSNVAAVKVRVEGGVFDDRGFVLGKVFADCNGNGVPDADEPGVPGVRLYLENGDFAVTDGAGRYHFYGLTPRTHVLKADRASLPPGARLAETSRRNAGDAGSLFVDLKSGELHRADFALSGCGPEMLRAIETRRVIDQAQACGPLSPCGTAEGSLRSSGVPAGVLLAGGGLGRGGRVKQASPSPSDETTSHSTKPASGQVAGYPQPSPIKGEGAKAMALDTLSSELGFIDLKDGAVLSMAQATVRVKGTAASRLTLSVNGVSVAEERVGTRVVNEARGVQAREYVGVALTPGINTLELVQEDDFGNRRGTARIQVTVPGELARIEWELPTQGVPADGRGPALLRLKLLDARGVPVSARTPLTLESSAGRWRVADLNAAEPGVQIFVTGGVAELRLVPPNAPGKGTLRATSGKTRAEAGITFLPALRDMLAVGVVEGAFNLRRLSPGAVQPAGAGDGFEREIAHFASGDAKQQAAARAALFLKGKVRGDYLLTLAYDSDKDTREGMFRDIKPDRYYPVYGDDAVSGFDARSSERLFVRVDKGKSFLLYGDFATPGMTNARRLAAYKRSLTGVRHHLEQPGYSVDSFASHDRSRRVVEEFPGNGTSGPYVLSTGDVVQNSEQVELVTRDGNQPGVVLSSVPQARFSDYEMEPFTGRILFRRPVPSTDSNLNPVFVRVTYESEQGGEEFWTTGVEVRARLSESVEAGVSRVDERDPQSPYALTGVNATVQLAEKTKLVAEAAASERAGENGHARRIELTHEAGAFKARAYAGRTDPAFDNPSAPLSKGRGEAGAKLEYRLDEKTTLRAEAIRTEDTASGGSRDGITAGVERVLAPGVRLEGGMRHAHETTTPAQSGSPGGLDLTTVRAKLSAQVPGHPQATAFVEGEHSVQGSGGLATLGGEYQLANRGRLYARHEVANSLTGAYGLNADQRNNTSVFGIDADYMEGGHTFNEYRARNAFSGRETEAAMGLRNRWNLADGLRLDTSFERVASLSGGGKGEAMAATGALDYTLRPDLKGTARLELRRGPASDSLLTTLGLAYKISDGRAVLGKYALNQVRGKNSTAADQTRSQLQLGLAWRDGLDGRLNGLSRYEFKQEDSGGASAHQRAAHVFSTHANYRPEQKITWSGRYAGKFVRDESNGLASTSTAHMVFGRVTRELGQKWDIGLSLGVLASDGLSSRQWNAGAELGYLLAKNLWASAGYNARGFTDRDLADSEYTARGVFVRLRFKFDEGLFASMFGDASREAPCADC